MTASLYRKKEHKVSPKTVALREEFVALTQDPLIAIVLNQLVYWTQRVKDFDLFLEEERFHNPECNIAPRHGWIYKTATDLIEETMICVDRTTMRRYLKVLITKGWLEERSHPHNKWDKTSQYRLNLRNLRNNLFSLGFGLPGISVTTHREFIDEREHYSEEQPAFSNVNEVSGSPSEENLAPSEEQIDPSERSNSPLNIQRLQTENTHKTRARAKVFLIGKMLMQKILSQKKCSRFGNSISVKSLPLQIGKDLFTLRKNGKISSNPCLPFTFKTISTSGKSSAQGSNLHHF